VHDLKQKMDLFIHELPKEKTKERVKVEVLSPAHVWDNSKAKAPGNLDTAYHIHTGVWVPEGYQHC
jgi:hypothetical protein